MGKQQKYSAEFKKTVILEMVENGLSLRKVTRKYFGAKNRREEDIYKTRPRAWLKKYREEGERWFYEEPNKHKMTKKERKPRKPSTIPIENDLEAENRRLNELVEYLQMENDYLKKLDALVRAEEQKKSKKRK